jgi:hypothetical protein
MNGAAVEQGGPFGNKIHDVGIMGGEDLACGALRRQSLVRHSGAVYEAKFMLPWSFSEDAAAEKYMAQLQHNMWVTNAKTASLSIITGGGKWVEIAIAADPLYQHLLLTAEKKFWRCVRFGGRPHRFGRTSRRCP